MFWSLCVHLKEFHIRPFFQRNLTSLLVATLSEPLLIIGRFNRTKGSKRLYPTFLVIPSRYPEITPALIATFDFHRRNFELLDRICRWLQGVESFEGYLLVAHFFMRTQKDVARVQELLEAFDRFQKLWAGLEAQLPTDVQDKTLFEAIVTGCLKDIIAVGILFAESRMFATPKLSP